MWLKIRSLLYFGFFIAVLLLSAGKNDKECWNDFSKANKYFSSRSFMSMDVEYKLWEAHVNTTPDYTFKGNYYRSDKSYYQEYSGIESIFNDSIYFLLAGEISWPNLCRYAIMATISLSVVISTPDAFNSATIC